MLYTLLISCTYFWSNTEIKKPILKKKPRPQQENSKISPAVIGMLTALQCITDLSFLSLKHIIQFSIQEGDKNIQRDCYNLLRADHPNNSKRGGVCIFYKEILGVHIVKSLSFHECIICEVSIQNSKCYFGVVCRSLS